MNNKFGKIDKETINAAKRGDRDALMATLSDDQRRQLQDTLNDKDKLKSILNSDAAQKLMKILGGNKNG